MSILQSLPLYLIHDPKLLQGYDWSLLPQDLTLVTVPTPHPKEGLKVQFHREPLQGIQPQI